MLLELLGRRVPIEGWFDGEDHTIVQLELFPGDPHNTPVSHMILNSFRLYLQVLGEFLSFFQGSRKLLQPPSYLTKRCLSDHLGKINPRRLRSLMTVLMAGLSFRLDASLPGWPTLVPGGGLEPPIFAL